MTDFPNFSHPPITEALIDLRFEGSSMEEVGLRAFVEDQIKQRKGWSMKMLRQIEATWALHEAKESEDETSGSKIKNSFSGFVLVNENSSRSIQVKKNRITVNYSKEYTTWDDIISDAKEVTNAYIKVAMPAAITRVAARYVNRIPLPSNEFSDFKKLMKVPPPFPPILGSGVLTDFIIDRVIKNIDGGYSARINTSTVQPLPDEVNNSLYIDIDVFKTCQLEPSFEAAGVALNEIRIIKNKLFFGSLTEQTLESFDD